jgi:hypothetical protein
MKLIVGIILLAALGISAGWWTSTQVSDAGTQVVKVGVGVADTVGDAITRSQQTEPTATK